MEGKNFNLFLIVLKTLDCLLTLEIVSFEWVFPFGKSSCQIQEEYYDAPAFRLILFDYSTNPDGYTVGKLNHCDLKVLVSDPLPHPLNFFFQTYTYFKVPEVVS